MPTQRQYILSPERIAWYVGPVGCAKTSSLCASVIVPALLYPGSKWFVGRWTWWTLEQTTLARFLECLNRLGPGIIVDRQAGPPMRIWIASARVDERGQPGEPSEIVFHGLDDIEKLGSTEFDGIAVDEANEITEPMANTLNSRLRHKRPGQATADGPFFLRLVSNPVRRSHWLHRKFCNESDCDPLPWGVKFRPLPSENALNLPKGYYDEISKGMSPEMKLRLIEGECGPDPAGLPVFPEFRPSLHVGDLKYDPRHPTLIRSWDFGRRRPASVIAQRFPNGWVNRLWATMGNAEHLERYGRRILQECDMRFPGASYLDVCDSHGTRKVDVSDLSSIDILNSIGVRPRYRDIGIEGGLELMSKQLCNLIDGRPQAMYDRVNANLLVEGYSGGYCYNEPKPGKALKEKPMNDGYYEHPMDCDRYICVNLNWGSMKPLSDYRKTLKRPSFDPYTGY